MHVLATVKLSGGTGYSRIRKCGVLQKELNFTDTIQVARGNICLSQKERLQMKNIK